MSTPPLHPTTLPFLHRLMTDSFSVLLSVVIAAISLTMLAPYSIDFSRAASGAGKLFSLMDRQSEIDPFDPSGAEPTETIGDIELENVSFAYPTRPDVTVLDNFSLRAPAGKVTALVVSCSELLPDALYEDLYGLTWISRDNLVPARAPLSGSSNAGTTQSGALSSWTAAPSKSSTSTGSARTSGLCSRNPSCFKARYSKTFDTD